MPYIPANKRAVFDHHIEIIYSNWLNLFDSDPGVGNYIITKLLHERLKEMRYTDINEVVGILECVKQELYRKVAAGYEDIAEKTNGKI